MVPSQKPSAKGRRYWAERYLVFNKVNKVTYGQDLYDANGCYTIGPLIPVAPLGKV